MLEKLGYLASKLTIKGAIFRDFYYGS